MRAVWKNTITLPYRISRAETEDGDVRGHLRDEERKPLLQTIGEDKYRRLVLLGDPDPGKSMSIDNLAWLVAGTQLGEIDVTPAGSIALLADCACEIAFSFAIVQTGWF